MKNTDTVFYWFCCLLLVSMLPSVPVYGQQTAGVTPPVKTQDQLETATFGGGCFWCTEAVFRQLKGVESVSSGYMGGHVKNPTYEQVCSKTTGHVEVIQIKFDPRVIRFDDLLKVHLKTHDPTTWDRQGNDKGPQYRSAIFYHNEQQLKKSKIYKARLNAENVFGKPVVTVIEPAAKFWIAEDYHQNYYRKNPGSSYCNFLIPAKLEKLNQLFSDKIKKTAQGRSLSTPPASGSK